MAKVKVPYTRRSDFSFAMAYIWHSERMLNRYYEDDGTFYDAIIH